MGTAGVLDFIVCDDRADADLARAARRRSSCIPRCRSPTKPERPTVLAFDLDPGEPATAVECAQVALRLRGAVRASSASSASPSTRARRGSRSTCRSTPRSPTSRPSPTRARSPRRSSAPSRSWSSRSRTEAAQGQGAGRLEPERLLEDDGRGLLAALPRAALGLDAADLGRGRGARRRRRPRVGALRGRRRCSSGSPSTATCSRPVLELEAEAARRPRLGVGSGRR